MKNLFKILSMLACAMLLFSCQDEPLTPDYETLCSFTTDNYKMGDRIVFERTNGQLDTLIVKLVEQKLYAESSKHLNDSAENGRMFAEVRIEMSDDEGNNGWYNMQLIFSLHYNYFYLLNGVCTWTDSHREHGYFEGAGMSLGAIPADIMITNDPKYPSETGEPVTFFELKKGVGLIRFGDRDGEIRTLKERL